MYYVAPKSQRGSGGMIIWNHVERLGSFKATDGVEYVVAKSKKDMQYSLPIYIGVGDKLTKPKPARYERNFLDVMLDEFFG